jgi:hypothetical protein
MLEEQLLFTYLEIVRLLLPDVMDSHGMFFGLGNYQKNVHFSVFPASSKAAR